MRPAIFPHDLEGFFGDLSHHGGTLFLLHVQDRTHMQATHRGMGVPGAGGSIFFKEVVQPGCVLGKILQFNRAVFDAGNRFVVSFHRHHDVQS